MQLVGDRAFEAVCEIKDKTRLAKVQAYCEKAGMLQTCPVRLGCAVE
jgi:hypothetical protein